MTAVEDAAIARSTKRRQAVYTPAPTAAPRATTAVPRTAVTPRVTATLERRQLWERRYRRRIRTTDTIVVLVACLLTSVVELLITAPNVIASDPGVLARVPLLTALGWLAALAIFNSRESNITGSGTTEYKRVAHATGLAFGILAIAFVVFQWQGIRMQLMLALPVGLFALLVGRWGWRRWLIRQRGFGHYLRRTLVVGRRDDVEYVIANLRKDSRNGYLVVGATLDKDDSTELTVGNMTYGVLGTINTVAQSAAAVGADAIVVASRPNRDPEFIKRLSWQLEGTASELILSSRLADVAGPRISLRPVDGLPLIHVKIPTFEGGVHVLKRALDILVATVALIPIAVIAPILAILIKLDSHGPVFFAQERVGRDGRTFKMLKFRSMSTTAEADLAKLLDQNEGSGPLFKLKSDPRVTRVGRVLRKLSLDELPQFWNVLIGDMSVVGPRPPLHTEVTAYDGTVYRRLYIKPGITGLWQVSGRSDLSWDESVRLDLRYVENWSVMNDLAIMWRTAKVMLAPKGAY